MRIVEGFAAAKAALARKPLFYRSELEPAVLQIINDVRDRGDAAVREYTSKFDGAELSSLEVSKEAVESARADIDSELVNALKLAAQRIRDFHLAQKRHIYNHLARSGVGQVLRPLKRAGIYTPGGRAYYPSTVLMAAIPAKVAGVGEVVLATPPDSKGRVPAPTLVAAGLAGVDRIFSVGGAQAIAALAFGTESIPRVDKICGPGGIYVALAKKLVYGAVGIDALQGPSEILIIADETADPAYCAADMLAQAEHDRLACAVLVTITPQLAQEVRYEIERQLKGLTRRSIIKESLSDNGIIAVVNGMDEAIELANLYAPEHLSLMVARPDVCLERISNAGCVFLGHGSSVVLGDYVAGPSHVLPTGGSARFASPLNVMDFIKITNVVSIDRESLRTLGNIAAVIARGEGLEAHARAVEKRSPP